MRYTCINCEAGGGYQAARPFSPPASYDCSVCKGRNTMWQHEQASIYIKLKAERDQLLAKPASVSSSVPTLRFYQQRNADPSSEELDAEWRKGESARGQCVTKLKNVSKPVLQYQNDAGEWQDVPTVVEIRETPIYE